MQIVIWLDFFFLHRFIVGKPQGGYYDNVNDSVILFGTSSNVCFSNQNYKVTNPRYWDQYFNYKSTFKTLKDTSFNFQTYSGSQGPGDKIYFSQLKDKQFYYMPFLGSALYKQPYTSIGKQNFITGLMDNANRNVIDEWL